METKLNAVINAPGDFDGFSANYSGAGFSGMRFRFHGLAQADFDVWIAKARLNGEPLLDRARYLELAEPSENVAPTAFGDVEEDLFRRVVNRCVEDGRLCTDQMMALDALGGTGIAGVLNTIPAAGRQASAFGHQPFYVAAFCTPADSREEYGEDTVVLLELPAPAGGDAPGSSL